MDTDSIFGPFSAAATSPSNLPLNPVTAGQDFDLFKSYGVTGIVTYSSTDDWITPLANSKGLDVVEGIWSPTNADEIANVVALANSPGSPVRAVVVGNEGLHRGDYDLGTLYKAVNNVRRLTQLPTTTTETNDLYGAKCPGLESVGDFLFPNVHPYWNLAPPYDATSSSNWTVNELSRIAALNPAVPAYIKETGFPTNDADASHPNQVSETLQDDFFKDLCSVTSVRNRFVPFAALDDPYGSITVEQNWGLFYVSRLPKPAAADALTGCK